MLQINKISKKYSTGEFTQSALDDVSFTLRDNEFVAVLGPSGSGKTTLLNIIGGLDRYDTGDLVINDVSTKQYTDRDWDSYRNHTIGFVFQSYNLIAHQSVLSNVELALTISGISKSERRRKAKEALERVGLSDHLHKRPNQMSGGQMQRVAIARALVNDPDILLADEPTGALDSETSVQVMELLKEVANDRLVVLVTHNNELAERYANRIIRLRDGKIEGDTRPYDSLDSDTAPVHKNLGKASMSFWTSLGLSFNNLLTKKGRTLLTSFAGSIGIIGIALILSLSTGVNDYIEDIQKETMTSYPISIQAETFDIESVAQERNAQIREEAQEDESTEAKTAVFADYSDVKLRNTMRSGYSENDLTAFKKYLDDPNSEIQQYLGENGVIYTYDISFDIYSYDEKDRLISSDAEVQKREESRSVRPPFPMMGPGSGRNPAQLFGGTSGVSGAENFQELMPGAEGKTISPIITDNYDLVHGEWPDQHDEVVLVLNRDGGIPTATLYQLGLITAEEYEEIADQVDAEEDPEPTQFAYQSLMEHSFYLVLSSDTYEENEDGTFTFTGDDRSKERERIENAIPLTVTGIIRPVPDTDNATLSSGVGYTSKLTDIVIDRTNDSAVVKAQEKNPEINVLTGLEFEAPTDDEKVEDAKRHISGMNISDKASLYTFIRFTQAQSGEEGSQTEGSAGPPPQEVPGRAAGPPAMDENSLAAAMDAWLANEPDEEILLSVYEESIAGASYDENMKNFGKVSYDAPYSISLYSDSFEDKERIATSIQNYNDSAAEEHKITYTDFVALLTSSITSIVDVISYVLIAFVAISLVVSCIMIGIITHISVLERTKEIGILRAIGASKRNISQVFNAETFIIGVFSGILGVGISYLLTFPINWVIERLIQDASVQAKLPLAAAGVLIGISMVITILGGLIPAKSASNKDPVIALRTE